MVLAVPVASARAFEVEAGGVQEHEIEPAEQIAPMPNSRSSTRSLVQRGANGVPGSQAEHRGRPGAARARPARSPARRAARQPVSAHSRSAARHQRRPDPPHRRRRVVLRRDHHHRPDREARPRAHQPLQLAARLELVEPAQSSDHPLADLARDPLALRDLEIWSAGRPWRPARAGWPARPLVLGSRPGDLATK
jgi:hypothetical protein